jgi:hypothetical protein
MPLRVKCDNCGSSYTLPDSRLVPGKRVQFLCRNCQHKIVVEVPAESVDAGATSVASVVRPPSGGHAPQPVAQPAARPRPAAAPVPANRVPVRGTADPPATGAAPHLRQPPPARTSQPVPVNVMWFVASNGGQQQRMSADGVKAGIENGTVHADTLLWRKGYAEWTRAAETAEWGSHVGRPVHRAQPAAQAAAGEHLSVQVAAAASLHCTSSSQVAVALPVVRAPLGEDAPHPVASTEAYHASNRPEPSPRARLTHEMAGGAARPAAVPDRAPRPYLAREPHGEALNAQSRWSPATDTYTGQKGKFTRRISDEAMAAARLPDTDVGPPDAETDVDPIARPWRMLAFGALFAAFAALTVSVLVVMRWRATVADLDECRARPASPPAAVASP